MSIDAKTLQNIVEGALLASAKPLNIKQIQTLFDADVDAPKRGEIEAALASLAESLLDRGIELKQVSSGYRLQVKAAYSHWIGRLWEERPQKYSRAMLETLSLVAYRQPITRGEIEHIRGVAVSSNIIRALTERDWLRIVGHKDVPGRPAMYATTKTFLDYFSLNSLDQLPSLAEIRDLDAVAKELNFEAEVLQEAKAIEQRELEREQRLSEQALLQAAEDDQLEGARQVELSLARQVDPGDTPNPETVEESKVEVAPTETMAAKTAVIMTVEESSGEPEAVVEMNSWDLMAEVAELDIEDESDIDDNTDRTSSPATIEYPSFESNDDDIIRHTYDEDDLPNDSGEFESDRDPGFDLLAEVLEDESDDPDEPIIPSEQE